MTTEAAPTFSIAAPQQNKNNIYFYFSENIFAERPTESHAFLSRRFEGGMAGPEGGSNSGSLRHRRFLQLSLGHSYPLPPKGIVSDDGVFVVGTATSVASGRPAPSVVSEWGGVDAVAVFPASRSRALVEGGGGRRRRQRRWRSPVINSIRNWCQRVNQAMRLSEGEKYRTAVL